MKTFNPKTEAWPIDTYLATLDRVGGARETKEILEALPRDIRVQCNTVLENNAFVTLNTAHTINGKPVLYIWINDALITTSVEDCCGDCAPHFQG